MPPSDVHPPSITLGLQSNPEKHQNPPVKTATLDKAVIDRIAQYYIRNGLEFEEKEVRRIYSLQSFRVLATNLLLKVRNVTVATLSSMDTWSASSILAIQRTAHSHSQFNGKGVSHRLIR